MENNLENQHLKDILSRASQQKAPKTMSAIVLTKVLDQKKELTVVPPLLSKKQWLFIAVTIGIIFIIILFNQHSPSSSVLKNYTHNFHTSLSAIIKYESILLSAIFCFIFLIILNSHLFKKLQKI